MARPRKSPTAEATPDASTETPSATTMTRRRGRKPGSKNKAAVAAKGNGRTRTSTSPITAFREGLAFYREMQKEIGPPGQPYISAQEWTQLVDDVERIGGMVTRLCEREGVSVTPLRTGTDG